ncbi:MAG: hypothetical protein ABSB97_04390 [Thermoplasmata archaeon]|jgi:hypothetical protein
MSDKFSEIGSVRATAAVVVRGTLTALDKFVRDVRDRTDIQVVYVKTGAGRLKIVPEEDRL